MAVFILLQILQTILPRVMPITSRNGLELPLEPEAHKIDPDPECVSTPIREINLKQAGITSVIWATGYAVDYNWLKADVFHNDGKPKHERGVTAEPGIYFLGLPWQSRRGSAFIWGVWHDAKHNHRSVVGLS